MRGDVTNISIAMRSQNGDKLNDLSLSPGFGELIFEPLNIFIIIIGRVDSVQGLLDLRQRIMLISNGLPFLIIPRILQFLIDLLDLLIEGYFLLNGVHVKLRNFLKNCQLIDYLLLDRFIKISKSIKHALFSPRTCNNVINLLF